MPTLQGNWEPNSRTAPEKLSPKSLKHRVVLEILKHQPSKGLQRAARIRTSPSPPTAAGSDVTADRKWVQGRGVLEF